MYRGIVTGAGNGIGYAISKNLIENNYKVYAITKTKSKKLESLYKKYRNKLNIFYLDLNKINETKELIKKITFKNNLNFLVNNAGIRSRFSLENITEEEMLKVYKNNFLSPFIITKEYLRNVNLKNKHSVVSISSIVGPRGFADLTTYASSKGALEAGMKSLAIEYANKNVRINSIAPGFVETSYYKDFKHKRKKLYKWTIERTPMSRWGKPNEIANATEFLVSKKSSYITGAVIYVDGGWTAS